MKVAWGRWEPTNHKHVSEIQPLSRANRTLAPFQKVIGSPSEAINGPFTPKPKDFFYL